MIKPIGNDMGPSSPSDKKPMSDANLGLALGVVALLVIIAVVMLLVAVAGGAL